MSRRAARPAHLPTVYRCFDVEGQVLYIGLSENLEQRLTCHRSTDWWRHVASVQTVRFCLFEDAVEAEREAISTEHPPFNQYERRGSIKTKYEDVLAAVAGRQHPSGVIGLSPRSRRRAS